ncbi:hypothetical protein Dimus_009923 [Dionaea muscipula]
MEVLKGVLRTVHLNPKVFDWSYLKGWILKVRRGTTPCTYQASETAFCGHDLRTLESGWRDRNMRIFHHAEKSSGELVATDEGLLCLGFLYREGDESGCGLRSPALLCAWNWLNGCDW